ncbi:MAG: tol-pal system protein YbgF [Hoeflea sp.]|uniref:tol-pal system protein YbgF n=1 Tax=Hoeflea sp. TaxID=1940281 RepID=UPI001D53DF80|nr:tol-pal system protein YbgF [Hoeflea sp.]MBU4530759.1 tol-pal system protein YbgF [Alphaproteobacteria bacterium]MBU4544758.1 tol-pal system protein YbgF [Alphaproteobacteria bacterium]MBU4549314.1 tol-pal system protein YbgF [Alphaproteobacteria bacterium]MBV1726353.1 tol-pal system protein YbgF [Hoeflea sp.]MBV1761695.1 tol-pal system protein YbgF [Hoeflea sp.]
MKPIYRLIAVAAFATASYPVSAAPLFSGFSHGAPPPAMVGSTASEKAPVILVQSGDPVFRIGQLEEQVRALTGRVEELGFQLLQMQEQMRQMQEDNEFRFQELEKTGGQRGDAGPAVIQPGVEETNTASTGQDSQGTGAPEVNLGTIRFNDNGDLIGGIIEPTEPGNQTASLTAPEDIYQAGYNHMLAGDYALAEQVFQQYVGSFPEGERAADAMFWLGEAQFSQGNYQASAQTFLDAHKQYPQADKGADSLLKLGMSLAQLDNRDTACATLREVLIRYPGASAAVRAKVSEEQLKASC